jgi:hypothetical protein
LFRSSWWYGLSLSNLIVPVNISSFSVIFLSGRSLFSLLYSFPCFFFSLSMFSFFFFSSPLSLKENPPLFSSLPLYL